MLPKFEFFEAVCSELAGKESVVLTRDDFGPAETDGTIIEDLEKEMKLSDSPEAIKKAVDELAQHFASKDGRLPFEYDEATGRFKTVDADYIDFVVKMSTNRGVGKESQQFEVSCSEWISKRLSGAVHRVGWPRKSNGKKALVKHLKTLGFSDSVAKSTDKDAGFDIVWLPPLGSVPHRLVVSIQCKNSGYDLDDANKSVGTVNMSLNEHVGLDRGVHVPCVLFNDYISSATLPRKRMAFLPLGLSDFVQNRQALSLVQL